MKKIGIVQSRLTHYRVPFYDGLKDDLLQKGISLELYVGSASGPDRRKGDEGRLPWAVPIHNKSFRLFNAELLWQPCWKELWRYDLVVVTQENRLLINYLLLCKRRLNGPKVAFWGHGKNLQSSAPNGPRETWKRLWLKMPDWWFAYTELTREVLLRNGYCSDKITVVNNAAETRELVSLSSEIEAAELSSLKNSLRIQGNNVGVFCGALYREKRIDFLIQSAREIRSKLKDFELVIIGAGPQAAIASDAARQYSWVHFVGPRFGREKVLYMKLAHIFLIPGLVGLAILDAFALGLPVFTTDCDLHSPEISYLRNGRNGCMTPNSVDSYSSAVIHALTDRRQLQSMSDCCRQDAELYTVEKMVDRFSSGVVSCLT